MRPAETARSDASAGSCRRWKAYQLALKIIKERAKKHRYLDPMPDSRTNEVKNRTKKYKGFSQ